MNEFEELFKSVVIPFSKVLGCKRKAQNFNRQANDTPQVSSQTTILPDGRRDTKYSEPYINQYYVDGVERLAKYYEVELSPL